jgi:hypothetical protein
MTRELYATRSGGSTSASKVHTYARQIEPRSKSLDSQTKMITKISFYTKIVPSFILPVVQRLSTGDS